MLLCQADRRNDAGLKPIGVLRFTKDHRRSAAFGVENLEVRIERYRQAEVSGALMVHNVTLKN